MPLTTSLVSRRHDDITYQSIAKAFNLPLKLHREAFEKMKHLSRPHPSQPNFSYDVDSPALRAKLRMVELPTDETRDPREQFLFPHDELWVPVTVVNGNVHILPGVPKLCTWLAAFSPAAVINEAGAWQPIGRVIASCSLTSFRLVQSSGFSTRSSPTFSRGCLTPRAGGRRAS